MSGESGTITLLELLNRRSRLVRQQYQPDINPALAVGLKRSRVWSLLAAHLLWSLSFSRQEEGAQSISKKQMKTKRCVSPEKWLYGFNTVCKSVLSVCLNMRRQLIHP